MQEAPLLLVTYNEINALISSPSQINRMLRIGANFCYVTKRDDGVFCVPDIKVHRIKSISSTKRGTMLAIWGNCGPRTAADRIIQVLGE